MQLAKVSPIQILDAGFFEALTLPLLLPVSDKEKKEFPETLAELVIFMTYNNVLLGVTLYDILVQCRYQVRVFVSYVNTNVLINFYSTRAL